MTCARIVAALVAGLFVPAFAGAQGANAKPALGSPTADRLPIYEIDPSWPPTLPNDWILGDIRGLFVDDRDHLGDPHAIMIAIDSKSRMYTGEAGKAGACSVGFSRGRGRRRA